MRIGFTPAQEALRDELRRYFAALMTPEVEAEVAVGDTGGPHCLEAVRRMGRDGWLGVGWPKEYGGQGRGPVEQFIFYDAAWRASVSSRPPSSRSGTSASPPSSSPTTTSSASPSTAR